MPVKQPRPRRPRRHRDRQPRRDRRAAAAAPARDAAARLRQRAALPPGLRRQGRASRRPEARWPTWRSSRSPPRRTCATTTPSACSRCRASRWRASMRRRAPPASRPWSATRRTTSTHWADLVARSIRAAGGRPGDMVHVAYGYGLFTGGLGAHYGAERAGLHRDPDVGRPDREAGAADPATSSPTSSWSRRSYMQVIIEEFARQGLDPRETLAQGRHLRRRAVDRGHAPRDRGARPASTRSTSTACPK